MAVDLFYRLFSCPKRGEYMAYQGYLIKVGNYTIPADKFIKADSYSVTRNVQDLDTYRDADGFLHRTALEHSPLRVEFETVPMLTDTTFEIYMSQIRANYTIPRERKVSATVWVPELGDYVTQNMYMADPQVSIYGTYGGKTHYNSVRFAFIGY